MQLATAQSAQRHNWLNGQFTYESTRKEDYKQLAHFHYAPGEPATFCRVWKATYTDHAIQNPTSRLAAVAVLSYPRPYSYARERQLNLTPGRNGEKLRWLNANLRTISRVIVHPQFRSLGLASELVRRILDDCPVRYVEAFAVMGRIVPFFLRAGMKEVEPGYFFFDRG